MVSSRGVRRSPSSSQDPLSDDWEQVRVGGCGGRGERHEGHQEVPTVGLASDSRSLDRLENRGVRVGWRETASVLDLFLIMSQQASLLRESLWSVEEHGGQGIFYHIHWLILEERRVIN